MNYKPQTTYYNNKMYYYDLLLMIEWHDTPHVHGKQTFFRYFFFNRDIFYKNNNSIYSIYQYW